MRKSLFWLLVHLTVSPPATAQQITDEFRQTYRLVPGAQVEIGTIRGSIVIETTEGDTSEVFIRRTARKGEDLAFRKIQVENSATKLVIAGEPDIPNAEHEVRQDVRLKLTRRVNVNLETVAGAVRLGEVDGHVQLKSIAGDIQIQLGNGSARFEGTRGDVRLQVRQLRPEGLQFEGTRGTVEIRYAADMGAEVIATGNNGRLRMWDSMNVEESRPSNSGYRGRIGAGGPPIAIHGVRGPIRIRPLQASSPCEEVVHLESWRTSR